MFTGLIQELGKVLAAEKRGQEFWLSLEAPRLSQSLKVGDSVAVNGCCLTAVKVEPPAVSFQAVPETLKRTLLGLLKKGEIVNLELPVTLNEPLGGHFVQGHVDGIAQITGWTPEGQGARLKIRVPESLASYMVEKGSIALDGISLTVASVRGDEVEVALIPHTLENTDLKDKKVDDYLQVEADILAKYVEKLSQGYLVPGKGR